MAELTAFVTAGGVPLVAPTDPPEVEVVRNDTQAIVQAFVAMVDQGNGMWAFTFAIPDTAVDYTFLVDGDPLVSGQVSNSERFQGGSFAGELDLLTVARITNLDNLDVAVSSRNSVVPLDAATDAAAHSATQGLVTAVGLQNVALQEFVEGGRDIDFVGDDVLGWQRIERDISGALIRRYNLFDEGGSRITGTVAAFIAAGGMISAEVAI
jgi:hypothetical protein